VIVKVASATGVILGAIIAVVTFWGTYGWITRSAYAVDEQAEKTIHEGQATQASIDALTTMIGTVIENQQKNQDEWKCDEADEAVIDLQEEIEDTTSRRKILILEDDLKTINKIRDDLDCIRFE